MQNHIWSDPASSCWPVGLNLLSVPHVAAFDSAILLRWEGLGPFFPRVPSLSEKVLL